MTCVCQCKQCHLRNYAECPIRNGENMVDALKESNSAQLAELHAISDALGTNEGHSSVSHILALKAEVARLRKLCGQAADDLEAILFNPEGNVCVRSIEFWSEGDKRVLERTRFSLSAECGEGTK